MVEEMYQQEAKEEEEHEGERERNSNNNTKNSSSNNVVNNSNTNTNHVAQTPTYTTTTETASVSTATPAGIRSEINATESDPSLLAINRPPFSENQVKQPAPLATATTAPVDTCRSGIASQEFGTTAHNMGPTLIRFGTTAGDVSLTLGLRHAGNMPDKSSNFSITDFGNC